jgi:uncharacterized protein YxjI
VSALPGTQHFNLRRDSRVRTWKTWFRLRDSYGVEIEPGQNDILILAATAAIDMISHPTC